MQIATRIVRATLALSFPFNLVAAYALAFPTSAVGNAVGLTEAPPVYTALLGFMVGLFGFVYGWLARQPTFDRRLLTLGIVGKLGAFTIAAVLWASDRASGRLFVLACGDLVLALVWLWWLIVSTRDRRTTP